MLTFYNSKGVLLFFLDTCKSILKREQEAKFRGKILERERPKQVLAVAIITQFFELQTY